jgi:CRP-like cAMP-binding protein
MPTTLWRITKTEMERALQSQPEFSHRFLAYMLQRNIQLKKMSS